jgi:hypothetical protein
MEVHGVDWWDRRVMVAWWGSIRRGKRKRRRRGGGAGRGVDMRRKGAEAVRWGWRRGGGGGERRKRRQRAEGVQKPRQKKCRLTCRRGKNGMGKEGAEGAWGLAEGGERTTAVV